MKVFLRLLLLAFLVASTRSPILAETGDGSLLINDPAHSEVPIRIGFAGEGAGGVGKKGGDVDSAISDALQYLQEGLHAMTRRPVEISQDLSQMRIILSLKENAPEPWGDDPEVREALASASADQYNANEAFCVRTEPGRVVIIANRPDGLRHGVVALLESIGYEVLGMGPDWIHVPDYSSRPLRFAYNGSGRPGFYERRLYATSAQDRGRGTLGLRRNATLHPPDEPVEASYKRWRTGTRIAGSSMPGFPGHALQRHHAAVLNRIRETAVTEGFLVKAIVLGLDEDRPEATPANQGTLWIDRATTGMDGVYLSTGQEWQPQKETVKAALDLSVPQVREVVLEHLKATATQALSQGKETLLNYATDPEDGAGYQSIREKGVRYPQWYPEYLSAQKVPFGLPYRLDGFKGLAQARETWDPGAASDHVFAFNNWLLREFDRWVASLPEERRFTKNGKPLQALIRCSLYSYNFHDVPPNFNLDPRIRVMIAGYPKNRGSGKWSQLRSIFDMASAFQRLLPEEPSGSYSILSLSFHADRVLNLRRAPLSTQQIHTALTRSYQAGIRSLAAEMDFNFGKMGPMYYLYAKMLWNPAMSLEELVALRERWLERAYGPARQEMKAYHDVLEGMTISALSQWAKAVHLLDAAGRTAERAGDAAVVQRINGIKQYWYFYYLAERNDKKAMREFVWKGQMAYTVPMHMVTRVFFKTKDARAVAGEALAAGPARYTADEVSQWWPHVLAHWPKRDVSSFADATLANGKKGRSVDLNDVTAVIEFQALAPTANAFLFNGGSRVANIRFFTRATRPGEEVGFKVFWPENEKNRFYRQRDVYYGISRWDPQEGQWEEVVDVTTTAQPSVRVKRASGELLQLAEVRYAVNQPGTYLFELGATGDRSELTSLDWDVANGVSSGNRGGLSYGDNLKGLTQSMSYFYIPKRTRTLDLEVWDSAGRKKVIFFSGRRGEGAISREVDISARGPHVIALEPGEDGAIAAIRSNGFHFPLLYSIPQIWAKSPTALLVPRAIAEADQLKPVPASAPSRK